ncbi:hypothetical protein YC2023_068677 [Brassica napus]
MVFAKNGGRRRKRRKRLRERERKERNAWEESTDVRRRVCARAGAGGSLSCRSSLGYPLCASICCPNRYIFGSGLGFYRRERTVYGGFQTAVSFREAEASFSSAVAVQVSGGWRLFSALRRRQSFREVEALTALRRRILLRGVKASCSLPRRLCSVGVSLVGGREKRPYQVGDVR